MLHFAQQKNRLLALTFFLAAPVFLCPTAAQAYEEDTHFTMTYVLCRAAGMTDTEAMLVATYDQGMDDSAGTVANGGTGGIIPNVAEESLWHSIPANGTANEVLARRNELWNQVLTEPNATNRLKRLGVFFHYQQDFWAHRYHVNSDPYNFTTYSTPFGHAFDGHQPDRPPFDPVCALRCLEDGIGYARTFVQNVLGRTSNALFNHYQPALGAVDLSWNDSRKGLYFNQLAADNSTPARSFLTDLVRSQVDAYTSSLDFNPNFLGRYTADQASYNNVRVRLQAACDRAGTGIVVPASFTRVTTLTTAQLTGPNLGLRTYTIRIRTGDRLWAGTDSNIFLSIRGTSGTISEQKLNPYISGNAFERNQIDTVTLANFADVGEIQSITVRSDNAWPAADWYLEWIEISSPGLTTWRFNLYDWIQTGKLTRTINR